LAVDKFRISALHSAPLIAAYTSTPHLRLVARLDLQNFSASLGFQNIGTGMPASAPNVVACFFQIISFHTTAMTTQAIAVKKAIRSHTLEEKDLMTFELLIDRRAS